MILAAKVSVSSTPFADAIIPFTGNVGVQIKNVEATDTYFQVNASYIAAMTVNLRHQTE